MSVVVDMITDMLIQKRKNSSDAPKAAIKIFLPIAFFLFGIGPSWVFSTVIFQETPYFQTHLYEGLCISAFMNAAVNSGSLAAVFFIFGLHLCGSNTSKMFYVRFLLILPFAGSIFTAFMYHVSIAKISFALYISCIIGGVIGSLSTIILSSFMSIFETNCISMFRAGASTGNLICSMLSLIQSPGSEHPIFSPTTYFLIFSSIFVISIVLFEGYIVHLPQVKSHYVIEELISDHSGSDDDNNIMGTIHIIQLDDELVPTAATMSLWMKLNTKVIDKNMEFNATSFTYTVYQFILVVGWANFNAWGVLPAIMPFLTQLASNDGNSGSILLNWAYSLSGVFLTMGNFSTMLFRIPPFIALTVFTISCLLLYIMLAGVTGTYITQLGPLVVISFSIGRFLEANILTTIYRDIASSTLRSDMKQSVTKLVAISDQVITTLGVIFSTICILSFAVGC